jgi:hypothetical protein
VRLGAYVALEVVALGTVVSLAGVGVRRVGAFLLTEARGAMLRAAISAQTARTPPTMELPVAPLPDIATTAERTFLGMSDEVLLERLRRAEVLRVRFNRGGSSISLRLEFSDGSRAAFKPAQTNPQSVPRKEIAAYRLDRLLGLGRIAPAAPRRLSREDLLEKLDGESRALIPRILDETIFDATGRTAGEAQFWIPIIKDTGLDTAAGIAEWTGWLAADGPPPPPSRRLVAAQLSTLIVFDLLTNNSDRFSGGNLVGTADLGSLYYLDNTFGFQIEPGGHQRCLSALRRVQRFSRSLYQRLHELDAPRIRAELAREPDPPFEILTDPEIDSVLARRDVALAYIDDLIGQLGREQVLYFP